MKRKFVVFCLLFVLFVSSCGGAQEKHTVVYVRSLKYYLPFMHKYAKAWASDSYLISADIPIEATGHPRDLLRMSVGFVAPSREGTIFVVYLYSDDTYETQTFSHTRPISQETPILEQDWSLDSIDAFDLLFDSKERVTFDGRPKEYLICSSLKLIRRYQVKNQLAWILTSSTCGKNTRYIYLDPKTGERLTPED
ncbi:MAG: hypothetical protein HY867_02840 [Chloroflexi bacterium]|nr:hypothetical protein [Chloroflexota bacterium]